MNHDRALQMARDGSLGQDESLPAYPTGWAQVSNTPFRFFKRTPLNGGIRVPFVLHWPDRIQDAGAIRREWIHVTDVTPTLLDVLGIAHPQSSHGFDARKPDGVSFAPMFVDGSAPTQRSRQHYELEVNRAFIDGTWKIASLQPRGGVIASLDNWMLFDLATDPCETTDLAAQQPERVARMAAAFDADARANYVYPLDNRALERAVTIPPFMADTVNRPRTFFGGTPTVARAIVAPFAGRPPLHHPQQLRLAARPGRRDLRHRRSLCRPGALRHGRAAAFCISPLDVAGGAAAGGPGGGRAGCGARVPRPGTTPG